MFVLPNEVHVDCVMTLPPDLTIRKGEAARGLVTTVAVNAIRNLRGRKFIIKAEHQPGPLWAHVRWRFTLGTVTIAIVYLSEYIACVCVFGIGKLQPPRSPGTYLQLVQEGGGAVIDTIFYVGLEG